MIKLAPSILSADFARLGEQVQEVAQAGADWLHIDVMDGHFVPNITIGPLVVQSMRPVSKLFFDVHLMIENPARYIEELAAAGADLLTVHQETCPHLHRVIQQIKSSGVQAGVAVNPATPLNVLEEILPEVDLVLLMSVNPGFGGQKYIGSTTAKISRLKEILRERQLPALIEVDGGINLETISLAAKAGADVLVAGNAVFGASNIRAAVTCLRKKTIDI